MYKLTESPYLVVRLADNAQIPLDLPYNIDAAEYMDWLAAGNTPEPYVAPIITDAECRELIKNIRNKTLELFNKNSGVSEVYALNFQAATLGAEDTTTILRNGKTPSQHLGDFGLNIGMTATQFVNYILTENLLAGQKMTEIEGEYLRIYYDGPMTILDVEAYQAYCDIRTS